MPIEYQNIDTAERAKAHTVATGYGDMGSLSDADAIAAERTAVVLGLRRAFLDAHAASADPDADAFAATRDALDGTIAEAQATRDRIVTATGADVSGVADPILQVNRTKAEQDHFDADWRANNVPDLSQDSLDECQLICDRAEREVGVIDGWGA